MNINILGLNNYANKLSYLIKDRNFGSPRLCVENTFDLNTLKNNKQNKIVFISAIITSEEIRKDRKDIFLITLLNSEETTNRNLYLKGLQFLKLNSCNLVLVSNSDLNLHLIVTPEEAVYHESNNLDYVLKQLIDIVWYRSHLTFTQSTVIDGQPISWLSYLVPHSMRTIVNYCINHKAYKVFNGSTVGHFAIKLSNTEFLTSIRKSNFNDLEKIGLVYVKTDGPDTVLAYGAKPSVGGQSQRMIFKDHPDMDCVLHFHCPLKSDSVDIPIISQREVECGSHQCGKNTSSNLKTFGNLKCVYLNNHGPNIVFNHTIDSQEVIDFITNNFTLEEKTGGYNL